MSLITVVSEPVSANATARLGGTIVQQDGVTPFKPDLVTLTLYDRSTGGIINGRNATDITSSVTAEGVLSFELTPEDNPIVTAGRVSEQHVALVEWEWDNGDREGKARVEFFVRDITA